MKILVNMILVAMTIGLIRCHKEKPVFKETVIDDHAPEDLWMKTIGDMNGDGRIDMLAGGWKNGGLVAYLGPDWEKQTINDSLQISTDAEVVDLDNNKIPDIVAVIHQAVVWFSGPDWKIHHIDSITGHDVEVYDFDNDGMPDVVARNQGAFGDEGGHTLFFYRQKPLGTWTEYQKEIPDGEGLKMADVNDDGKQDIITNAWWFENTGNIAEWKEHKFSDTWIWPNTYIAVGDINGDGRADILHSPSELQKNYYRVSWFEAPEDRTGTWKEHRVVDSIETVVHSIGAADFDEDGRTDIVIAEMQQGADPDEVAIFYNAGNDAWEKQVISIHGCHSMRVFDADGDGDMDIFGANFAEHVVRMWINQKQK